MNTQSTFNPGQYVPYMRTLDLMQLLAYQDALRSLQLSTRPNKRVKGERADRLLITSPVHVDIVNMENPGASKMQKGTVSTAIDHFLAVNYVLRERGYKEGADPEMTMNFGLLEDI